MTTRPLVAWLLALVPAAALAYVVHTGPLRSTDALPTVEEVQSIILSRYVGTVDEESLLFGAIDGMVDRLDPYSDFLTPEESRAFQEETEGEYGGIGIYVTLEDGYCKVIAPLEGTPAFDARILPGDRIIEIDGAAAEFATVDEATRVLKGPEGSQVTLTIHREGVEAPIEVTLTRRRIHVDSVRWAAIIDPAFAIGYFRLSAFQRETAVEVLRAVETLRRQGAHRLIIDLRSNPGGMLDASVQAADIFLSSGLIVETRGRDPAETTRYEAVLPGTLPRFPIACLVNETTASAAEILAGALQGNGRAILVGERTFGKGSVQSVIQLGGDTRLKLTTALYFVPDASPDGRNIHRLPGARPEDEWGLIPDFRVPMTAADLQQVFRAREEREIGRLSHLAEEANGGPHPEPPPATEPGGEGGETPLPEDPQLDRALEWIRAMPADGDAPAPAPAGGSAG